MFCGDAGSSLLDQLFKGSIAKIAKDDAGSPAGKVQQFSFELRIDGSRHHEQVRPTVIVEIHDARSPAGVLRFHANVRGQRYVRKISLAIVAIQTVGIVGKMRLEKIERAIEVIVADTNSHAGLFHPVLAEGDAAQQAFLAKRAVMIVHEKQAGSGIAGDKKVRPTVIIEISRNHGHAIALAQLRDASLLTYLAEGTVAIIVIERMIAGRQATRSALDGSAFPGAVAIGPRLRNPRLIELQVVCNEEIEVTVAIVVEEGATLRPSDADRSTNRLVWLHR